MVKVHERSVKKLKNGHYVATRAGTDAVDYAHSNRGYWTDGEESQRAPSERTLSEYTTANERNTSPPHLQSQKYRTERSLNAGPKNLGPLYGPPTRIPPRAPSALSYENGGDTGSDIYVTSAAYRAPSEYSRYTHRSNAHGPRSLYSVASSTKTGRSNRSRRAGARLEAMSAPNPFCPNVKGVCCLMLLLNLGLILVTLGFVIVIQFIEPFVWILGLVFLIFGFATLIGSMIYCVVVCRDAKTPAQVRNEDLYWTRYWQKNIGYTPHEINYKADRYNDAYSDRYSVSKISGKYSDRESNRY